MLNLRFKEGRGSESEWLLVEPLGAAGHQVQLTLNIVSTHSADNEVFENLYCEVVIHPRMLQLVARNDGLYVVEGKMLTVLPTFTR